MIHIICSNQYVNWKGDLKRTLCLLKFRRRIRVQKQKFLKSGKNIFNNTSLQNFLMMTISCNSSNTTHGIEPSREELIITKEEVRKAISSLKNNKVPTSDLITAEVLKAGEPTVNTLYLIFSKILNDENTSIHFSKMMITPV